MKIISFMALLSYALLANAITQRQTTLAFNQLQTWYNESSGLWIPSTGWWNSANCLTVIADLADINPVVAAAAEDIYPNTYTEAQKYNLALQKTVDANTFLIESHSGAGVQKKPVNGFLNDYYDDEGWWALAWIAVYDRTGDRKYLRTAESIFEDMASAYGTTPCGGLWWNKDKTYVNAIANELFLDVAAHLANRAGAKSDYYLDWAKKEWRWFKQSGMLNSQNLINDGLDNATCQNNGGTVWSYNQGVILGGLTELSRATGNESYITTAKLIADAAIEALTDDNGILHDPCEPNCGADGSQFKGVFARNLQILHLASPEERYATFLQENADSIWRKDRSRRSNQLSLIWSGPFVQPANASTQSSAMDALVGALAVSGA